jgi:aerobic carbon-monoxide dehydrogenase small subunit
MKHLITLHVNGQPYSEEVESRTLLVHCLRERLGLTGTHVGCVVGECGACSVLVDGVLVKSCLMLAVQANGREVTTVEGLTRDGVLHPVQEAFVRNFALQCGFCTPGFVMASHALLERNPQPTEQQIRKDLSSNLCMCTGYMQIVEAVKEAAIMLKAQGSTLNAQGSTPGAQTVARPREA